MDALRADRKIGAAQVCTSIVVVAELRYWCGENSLATLSSPACRDSRWLDVLPSKPCGRGYGVVRTELERKGNPIGANDMLIAAHALSLGLTLVTANEREFSRVEGLSIENWLR
jgi:tRNA(fMet)-specific endonuclease VapC